MVAIVDDDDSMRSALQGLLKAVGLPAQAFASAEEFLKSGQQREAGCLIADIRMPGMSGLELQAHLNAERCMATLDVLGEDVTRREETEQTVLDYERALAGIAVRRLDSNISVKLTALGLKLDPALCRRQFARIVEAARALRARGRSTAMTSTRPSCSTRMSGMCGR